ncbi:MAG: cation diffusion facilitator family transporter [Firmicutes bacterium]|nr:cation diffusion facilitator family transporter [Bacillota bacterium]
MTELLIRLFIKNHQQIRDTKIRAKYGLLAGVVGIICNVILFAAKLAIGILSGSLAITADAVNNLSDASSSVVTLLGFHLSQKPPDDEHPFGHARFEYLSGLAVAALILIIGFQLGKDSIVKIIHPTPVEFSWALVIVLLLSIAVKLWMALFYQNIGRRIDSASLQAAAADSRNDMISTGAVLVTAVIAHLFHVNLDGYIGFLVALFILYSGAGIAKETIKPLLGAPADPELVEMVVQETLDFDPRILGIHDLVVHDYGPGQCFASMHAELDYRMDVLEAHELIDDMERMFRKSHNIQLVVHFDPVVTDDEELTEMKAYVCQKAKEIDSRLHLHDFRIVRGKKHTNLIFDLVIPRDYKGREKELQQLLNEAVQQADMKYYTVITFDDQSFNAVCQERTPS